MDTLCTRITNYCIRKGIIAEAESSWFQYGIEKRISSFCIGIPFFALACLLSQFDFAVGYFFSFFLLRRRTNGYHAKNAVTCLFASLSVETVAIILFQYLVRNSPVITISLHLLSALLVFKLAPYNDTNIHLTDREVRGCRKYARMDTIILTLLTILLYVGGNYGLSGGITAGITTASFLLCLAYIKKYNGGNKNEKDQ